MPKKNVLIVTKWSAATSQLETAIQLWFNEGDPVSIHTLAVAAHDCFNALSTFASKPSLHQKWIKSQPKKIQDWAREPQNFSNTVIGIQRGNFITSRNTANT
jgi:hypothetical protein